MKKRQPDPTREAFEKVFAAAARDDLTGRQRRREVKKALNAIVCVREAHAKVRRGMALKDQLELFELELRAHDLPEIFEDCPIRIEQRGRKLVAIFWLVQKT